MAVLSVRKKSFGSMTANEGSETMISKHAVRSPAMVEYGRRWSYLTFLKSKLRAVSLDQSWEAKSLEVKRSRICKLDQKAA